MPANVITTGVQVGQSGTAANNFTVRTLDDGSLRISRGNAGAETSDVLVIDSDGNFSTAPVLGLGQTWQNMTASRALGVTYTNTTGRPIEIRVRADRGTPSTATLSITINGVASGTFAIGTNSGGGNACVGTSVIPNGTTYMLTSGDASMIEWFELR